MKKKRRYPYNIYIIGFMGSGKSTLLRAFARVYRMDVCDTDKEIEKKEGMSVSEIHKNKGMDYFIEKELEVLKSVDHRKGVVVSCGGETPLTEEKLDIIKRGKVVFLKTPAEETVKRILRRDTRPTAEGKTKEELLEMLKKYENEYEPLADIVVYTYSQGASEAADLIISKLYV